MQIPGLYPLFQSTAYDWRYKISKTYTIEGNQGKTIWKNQRRRN